MNKIFISAGELSGDLHSSLLVIELKKLDPGIEFAGIGGRNMKEQGVNILYDIKSLAAIGYLDVVKKYPFYKKVLAGCLQYVKDTNPDVIILTDFPGFNLKFAESLREFYSKNAVNNKKIIYYISPQLWAWQKNRIYKIKELIDLMLVIFPFEKELYDKFDIPCNYIGHPLAKPVKEFLKSKKSSKSGKSIILMPGSRETEVRSHLPVMLEASKIIGDEFKLSVSVLAAEGIKDDLYEEVLKHNFNLVRNNKYEELYDAAIAVTKAGTSTIECTLIGTPFMIVYKTHTLNYHLLKPFVKVKKLGMVNILAGKDVVREFIQKDFTVENIVNEARKLLTDGKYRNKIESGFSEVSNILGSKDAGFEGAKIIYNFLA